MTSTRRTGVIVWLTRVHLLAICLLFAISVQGLLFQGIRSSSLSLAQEPALIRQGPLGISQSASGDPYWFQTGAMGGASSSDYVAASVQIRTAYDQVNNDAHSYWVGGFIANGAFVQVGFLNEVSTTNRPYCCAWFYEYFYAPPNNGCCAPKIGPAGSAGPIGSWHNYTMASSGNGVWSFYLDGSLLGSTPDLGGTAASNSGSYTPGAIAEVASASSNTDILGPSEFKDLSFRTVGSGWQTVPSARDFIWYGKGTSPNPPPNPYGVREVEGVDNDFLVGSYIPPLDSPSQNPGTTLWPSLLRPPCCISFTFMDEDNTSFQPTWISLRSSTGNPIFYTQYQNQLIDDGTWDLTNVAWHSVNVALPGNQVTTPGTSNKAFLTNVFSIRLQVVGVVSGLPVSGASVTTTFLDTLSEAATTDGSGNTVLAHLPPGAYVLRIRVPYGIPAILNENVTTNTGLTARVFATAEVLLIAGVPVFGAVGVVALAISRERRRRAAMPTIPPSFVMAAACSSCGQPLHPGQMYCTNCGTTVKPVST